MVGAVLGLAITSTIFNNKLIGYLLEAAPGLTNPGAIAQDPSAIRNPAVVPLDLQPQVIDAFNRALSLIYLSALPFAGVSALLSLGIKWKRMPGHTEVVAS